MVSLITSIIMSAFYTLLSSLYNCLLKFISLMILLGEVRMFLGGGGCCKFKVRCKIIPGEVRTSFLNPALEMEGLQ